VLGKWVNFKQKSEVMAESMAQGVKYVPGKCKVLGSISSAAKNFKKTKSEVMWITQSASEWMTQGSTA
jgi:hypothetical protein